MVQQLNPRSDNLKLLPSFFISDIFAYVRLVKGKPGVPFVLKKHSAILAHLLDLLIEWLFDLRGIKRVRVI